MAKKVLIIDDEKHLCSVLGSYLEDMGFETAGVLSLAEARETLKDQSLPDLILLDVMLGDGNGMVFLREIRFLERTKHIPVIMMSAHRIKSADKVTGFEFGADDYINKPFELKEVLIRIKKVLNRTPVPSPSPIEKIPSAPPPASTQNQSRVDSKNKMPWLDVLLDPFEFFSSWEESSHHTISLGVLTLISVGYGLQIGAQEKQIGVAMIATLASACVVFSVVAGLAWLLQWLMGIKGTAKPFSRLFELLGTSLTPLVISSWLGFIYVLTAGGQWGELTAGPSLLLGGLSTKTIFGFLMRRFDLFELWSLWLLMTGLIRVVGCDPKKTRLWTAGSWIVMALVSAYLWKIL